MPLFQIFLIFPFGKELFSFTISRFYFSCCLLISIGFTLLPSFPLLFPPIYSPIHPLSIHPSIHRASHSSILVSIHPSIYSPMYSCISFFSPLWPCLMNSCLKCIPLWPSSFGMVSGCLMSYHILKVQIPGKIFRNSALPPLLLSVLLYCTHLKVLIQLVVSFS